MMEKTKKSPARIQYRAVQALVEQKRAEGYSLILIYEVLLENGYLTMSYSSFCDYVRGGGARLHKKPDETPKEDASELLSEILDAIEMRTDSGCNLKLVYQKLVECGLIGFSYSDFCDQFREAGAYLGRDIPEDYIYFEDGGLITFYYRLESLLNAESDKAAPQNLQ